MEKTVEGKSIKAEVMKTNCGFGKDKTWTEKKIGWSA